MKPDLTPRLQAIGLRVVGARAPTRPLPSVDVEETLLEALREAEADPRLASILVTWIGVHGPHVLVEKLVKLVRADEGAGTPRPMWLTAVAAFAARRTGHGHKWRKLVVPCEPPRFLYDEAVTRSAIGLRGAVDWLAEVGILVPEGSLRLRDSDVLTPVELARRSRQYRNRLRYGASWRADIITAIEEGASTPTEIKRAVGCSYEPAHRVLRDYRILQEAEAA